VNGKDARLRVADDAVQVASNIDVHVFNVYFEVVPAANQTASLQVATGPGKVVVLPWGISIH
jgi:hypothetical protein